jgi:FlaA1/EpsC-like NDP-sugar epimerase
MVPKGLKVIITGSTGMVGEGVLLVCLRDPDIEKILVINRRPLGIQR